VEWKVEKFDVSSAGWHFQKMPKYQGLLSRVKRLNYRHVLPDVGLIIFSLYLSLFLRLNWEDFRAYVPMMNRHLALFVVLRLGVFVGCGVYDIIWRYISIKDSIRLFKAVVLSSVIIIAATYIVDIGRIPRATFFIDMILVVGMLGGLRFTRRFIYESHSGKKLLRTGRLTLIYGAGSNGRTLANRFFIDSDVGFHVAGFIDDDPKKVGRLILGVKVFGTGAELSQVIRQFGIQEVVVAITRPSGSVLREVVQVCRLYNIRPRLVTSASKKPMAVFRDIGLSDLLNREKRHIDLSSVKELIRNKKVLITGAGGSIGSELARQLHAFGPSRLFLLDHSEYGLYEIDHELRLSPDDVSLVIPLLVDIKDEMSLRNVFRQYQPQIVFHAAAYKHVHLVENNPYPAILNNVKGTKHLLDLSEEYNVDCFVQVSTDKAVNPAGVMGATKRLCELMVTEVGSRTKKNYSSVRFGNVLGSSGSLIPLLKSQIENGEPVTITHKDMTRYFMLTEEAVSLVLKAATMAEPGDIMILRMGEPVKILDIAKSLIALLGKTEEEVPIVYTNLRPGEKIFEELCLCGKEINTQDPDILVLPKGDLADAIGVVDFAVFYETIERMVDHAQWASKEAIVLLQSLIQPKPSSSETKTALMPAFLKRPSEKQRYLTTEPIH